MEDRIEKILNYAGYPPTSKCYLDGRYFNLVLEDVAPLILHPPMHVDINSNKDDLVANVHMDLTRLVMQDADNIIRVIINSRFMRHSSLLIISPDRRECYMWDAITEETLNEPAFKKVHELVVMAVKNYLKQCFDDTIVFTYDFTVVPKIVPENCDADYAGYCNAYILLKALSMILEKEFNPIDILRFVTAVELQYQRFLCGEPDIEYYYYGGGGLGLGLGLLGGLALGAAFTPRPAYYPAYPAYYPAYPGYYY
ncbi:Hypothetical protein POVR1_LOCUS394 [uncultured virus]|nr:Hypothetical protein POVR1_LOCUS394 [uncultured virus]